MGRRVDLSVAEWAPLAMSWPDGQATMTVRTGDGAHDVDLVGSVLRYRATDRRTCLGHSRIGGGRVDCTNQPAPDAQRCQRCQLRNAGFAASLHHAHNRGRSELSDAALAHLAQPNRVYIAAFGDGSLKVGTSTTARLSTRLLEQGAWQARIVASADDGFAVREMEDTVTMLLELPQSVSTRRKLNGVVAPVPSAAIESALDSCSAQARELVERSEDRRLHAVDETWSSPEIDLVRSRQILEYPFSLARGTHHLEVITAIGRIIVVRRPGRDDDLFAADFGALLGVFVRPGEFETDEIAIQDSLF